MVRKIALAVLFALALSPAASFAQVVIRVGPPAPIVEVRGAPPERGFVWIDGYHRYDGGRYVWTPGRWERPPHEGAHWVAHRWAHRHGEWVLVEGHWR
jgi:opacity protein-like surface antigen